MSDFMVLEKLCISQTLSLNAQNVTQVIIGLRTMHLRSSCVREHELAKLLRDPCRSLHYFICCECINIGLPCCFKVKATRLVVAHLFA